MVVVVEVDILQNFSVKIQLMLVSSSLTCNRRTEENAMNAYCLLSTSSLLL